MSVDQRRQMYDEICRELRAIAEEERREMMKEEIDRMALYQISAERAELEEELDDLLGEELEDLFCGGGSNVWVESSKRRTHVPRR